MPAMAAGAYHFPLICINEKEFFEALTGTRIKELLNDLYYFVEVTEKHGVHIRKYKIHIEVNGEIQCHWAEEEFCKCPCDSSRYIYKIRKASFVGGISNVVEIDATITVIENCEKEKILIWTWRNENVPSTSNDWCSLDADYFYAKLAKITLEKLEKKLRKCDEDPCPLGAAPPPAADSAPPPAADSA